MSEEIQQDVQEEQVDYKALYESTQTELEKIRAKQQELLTETKKAKEARLQEQQERTRVEQEKAKKDGEFEKLWESAEQQRKELEQALMNERNSYKQEKIHTHAMKLAVELADGDATSAKLLSRFVQERLINLSDEKGSLDNDVLVAVKTEFLKNQEFAPLLAGSKANGGGALGAGNGVAKPNTIDRKAFNDMNPQQQREFIVKQKGQVVDN